MLDVGVFGSLERGACCVARGCVMAMAAVLCVLGLGLHVGLTLGLLGLSLRASGTGTAPVGCGHYRS